MALRNKMDISIGNRRRLRLQIALFVRALLVFASYCSRADDLEFTVPEVVAVISSIIIVEQISSDGESNWLEGVATALGLRGPGDTVLLPPDAHPAAPLPAPASVPH